MRGLGSTGRAAFASIVAVLLTGMAVLLGAAPARAQDTFIQVTPNPARAGSRVALSGSCGDGNTVTATATSDAFGRVVLMPRDGMVTGNVTVPSSKRPGRYNVHLQCQNNRTADTTLTVTNLTPAQTPAPTMSPPPQGPNTGGGGTADEDGSDRLVLTGGLTTIGVGIALGLFALLRRRPETAVPRRSPGRVR
ncbi:hypothetical protein SAMN05444365_11444 [Micromonospora pattaloongensis]|uniref:MYXO-CTERM domain-containing protein n=1 Tax=Micromonospora pattaloongensis TaxID=405436 RepID=A0A1H3SV39_9ACTN|nr:hypothetical protein [Micromonospora pattaloongensis]SDZ41518.1 hypothetical protein SAMN05444365_11444 [Micromonospora pattaloongensis]